ncbi:MAG: FtsX-like permease family protein [Methanomassiliicoccales archaeon PtaB.Bin134]|nr:MAG: FtsX-like permease family protein [Methanomassiliicoccales archaeon PtaB.Bin134]
MSLTSKMMLRRLRGRKLSLALSSFIIAWALAMMAAGLYSSEVIETSASSYLDDSRMPYLLVSLYEGRSPEEIGSALASLPVQASDLRLKETGQVLVNGSWSQATIIGISDPARTDISRLTLLEGRLFTTPSEGVVIAGGKVTGGTFQLLVNGTSLSVDITGVVRSPEYLFNELQAGAIISGSGGETIVMVPLSTLMSASGHGANEVALMLDSGSREVIAASLASLPVSSMTFSEDHPTTVLMDMGASKMAVMLPSISLVFVLIGGVSIFITMYRMVVSDSRNMGVLMSLGMERWRIAASYLGMGAVTLLAGGALGILLGYGFTVAMVSMALQMMGGIPVVLPFSPAPFLISMLMTALVVLAASLLPVALVLRQDIRTALSYVPRSHIWTWRGPSTSLSTSLGIRNLFRDPKRAVAVMMAVGLTVGAAGSWLVLLDSSTSYIYGQSSSYLWDVSISFTSLRDQGEAVERFSNEQVEKAMPYTKLSGLASSGGRTTGVVMTASPEMASIRSFDVRQGSLDFSGAVMAKRLAGELGVGPGSMVGLTFGGRSIELMVTGVVDDLQTNAVYTSNRQASSVIGEDVCQGMFVSLRSSDQLTSYISSINTDPWVAGVQPKEDAAGSVHDLLASAISLFYGFFVLNLLIALAVATSAVVVSTSERDLEFSAVSSLGLPRSFTVRSLLVEAALLGLISSLLAVPFAYLLAQVFAGLMEEAVFYIPVVMTVAAALSVILVGWAFTTPSAIWPIRWTRKMDMASTLRERLQ